MPYITKNTFYRIVSEIDLRAEPSPTKARLEGKNLTILSKKELQRLALITEILGSEFIPEDRFFLKINKPNDSYSYIHPERVPSYHIDRQCTALTKEYENYEIPIEIREQGPKSVLNFRNFFFEKNNLFKEDREKFYLLAKQEFKLKKVLTDRDLVEIKAPNSGKGNIQDFNISTLEADLDKSIIDAENYKNDNVSNRFTINKYGNLYKPVVEDSNEIIILRNWSEYKKEIKRKYIIFSMLKNNPEINLDGNFLDALGLNKCSFCLKEKNDLDFMGLISES